MSEWGSVGSVAVQLNRSVQELTAHLPPIVKYGQINHIFYNIK